MRSASSVVVFAFHYRKSADLWRHSICGSEVNDSRVRIEKEHLESDGEQRSHGGVLASDLYDHSSVHTFLGRSMMECTIRRRSMNMKFSNGRGNWPGL